LWCTTELEIRYGVIVPDYGMVMSYENDLRVINGTHVGYIYYVGRSLILSMVRISLYLFSRNIEIYVRVRNTES